MYASLSWQNTMIGRMASNGEKKNEMSVGSTEGWKERINDGGLSPAHIKKGGEEDNLDRVVFYVGDGVLLVH